MKNVFLKPLMAVTAATLAISCSNDDDMSQQQDGTFTVENVVQVKDFVQSGTFKGQGNPPVVFPGQSVSIKFNAAKGQRFAFATMYGASKDWFFAPENPGLKLYNDDGSPITGNVSSQIKLWDNGTKQNTTGDSESKSISEVPGIDASSLVHLNLSYQEDKSEFTLTIQNTSGGSDNETPLSPGVWAVSNTLGGELLNTSPFYAAGEMSNPEVTALAETGNNEPAAMKTETNTGIITGISPVVVVVYSGEQNPIFKMGDTDMGNGLKAVAQTGDFSQLKTSLMATSTVKNVYVLGNAPIGPGAKEMSIIQGQPGDKVAFVTMFGYSNDWFYANSEPLMFGSKGDLTSKTELYDNGTAIDQFPGAGNAQALFGGTPIAQDKSIEVVENEFPVPAKEQVLKITLQ